MAVACLYLPRQVWSTLRWNRIPDGTPRIAPSRVAGTAVKTAIVPSAVRSPWLLLMMPSFKWCEDDRRRRDTGLRRNVSRLFWHVLTPKRPNQLENMSTR